MSRLESESTMQAHLTFLFFFADSANSMIVIDSMAKLSKIDREKNRDLAISLGSFLATWLVLREHCARPGPRPRQ